MNLDIVDNPYTNFIDLISNKHTKRGYHSNLKYFLELIPDQIFKDNLGYAPNREMEDLLHAFVELAKNNPVTTKNIIKSYLRELNNLVEKKELSPNTVPGKIKPIKALFAANDIDISWKMINKMLPRATKSDDRAYTKEEIKSMLEHTNLTDKVIILLFSSAGFRLEAWDYFTWDDVIFFEDDGSYKGAALRVYRGDPEEYWTFITPEACDALSLYREEWRSRFSKYPKKDDPLLVYTQHDTPHRLCQRGVRARVSRLLTRIGLRNKLKKGKGRYEVKLDHGFRKYFNTMMRRAKVNYLDKEDMMGHKTGLESNYERYVEEDFERFSEYQKAIPFLTINDHSSPQMESDIEKTSITLEKIQKIIQVEIKKALREPVF